MRKYILVTAARTLVACSTSATPGTPPATSTPAPDQHTFGGWGTTNVGTIKVRAASTLTWSSSYEIRIVNDMSDTNQIGAGGKLQTNPGEVKSNNSTPVQAGTYHNVTVLTKGPWAFTISPG
jgi:hypothetical protein